MKTKISISILGLGILFTLFSCTKYPPASDRLLEDLVVMTQYDTKADFNQFKTFQIASKVIKITDNDTTEISNATTAAVLAQIELNMLARGFIKQVTPTMPDLGIQVVYFQNTYIYTYSYDWYYPYYPYWGYYYPYYPVYYASYTTGLANIEMIDLKNPDPVSQKLYLRWNAYIRGLLEESHTTSEITHSVDQAFIQTPQLQTSAN